MASINREHTAAQIVGALALAHPDRDALMFTPLGYGFDQQDLTNRHCQEKIAKEIAGAAIAVADALIELLGEQNGLN